MRPVGRSSTRCARTGSCARVARVAGARTGSDRRARHAGRRAVVRRGPRRCRRARPGRPPGRLVRAGGRRPPAGLLPARRTARPGRSSGGRRWPARPARWSASTSPRSCRCSPAGGGRPARSSTRSHPTCCSRRPPRRRRCSAAIDPRACSTSRRWPSSSAGSKGATVARPGGRRPAALRGRHRARDGDRHDRRGRRVRRRLPRRLVRRAGGGSIAAGVAPAGGAGRPSRRDAASCRRRGRSCPSPERPTRSGAQVAVEPGADALVAVDPAVGAAGRARRRGTRRGRGRTPRSGGAGAARRRTARCRRPGSAGRPRPGASAAASGRSRRGAAVTGARACRCPPGENGSPSSDARSYSGPLSELAQSLTWLVTPFSDTAALNRSVVPTSQLTMNPP